MLTGLFALVCSATFLRHPRLICLKIVALKVGWMPFYQLTIKKMPGDREITQSLEHWQFFQRNWVQFLAYGGLPLYITLVSGYLFNTLFWSPWTLQIYMQLKYP